MKIIIAGDGETGTHLARILSVENQDIVLMGTDRERLSALDSVSNFITFEGSPMVRSNLLQCGVDKADVFVAVTPDETVNIISCEIAKDCGARKCVARVDTPEFATGRDCEMFVRYGIDKTIYPEKLAAIEVARFINHNWVGEWSTFRNGALIVAGVRMSPSGTLCDRHLRDVPNNPRPFHVSAIKRDNEILIPRGDDVIKEGDTVYFSVTQENIGCLPELCGKEFKRIERIMVTGAGRVTENLLEMLGARYDVTVIDPDKERCMQIASRFPEAVVVNARANDVATLKEEGIDRCDAFLALTGSSETNIVSCMVAREHGVAKTVARIEDLQYLPEAESLSIDKIVNKKLLNAGMVLNVLLDTNAVTAQCISLDNAEVVCLVAPEGSKIVSRPICELSMPR
ncbi:MAG: Trk system potassium transporter TrkA, partial [Muribaculaceae bacterium]|nr:Trk system potassium transporter TrkA [Muribaculaceae bacterium]